jgi:hypothetical protein
MKTFILLTVFCSLCFGQSQVKSDKAPDPMYYYPYHLGDIWQYYEGPAGILTVRKITRIDTLSPKIHLIYYNNNPLASTKVDLDSNIIFEYLDHWVPWFKLGLPLKSYWMRDSLSIAQWAFFYEEDSNEIFGREIMQRVYYSWSHVPFGDTTALAGAAEFLAAGIGVWLTEWEGGQIKLIGCIIDGIQYGIILNAEDESNTLLPEHFSLSQNYPNPFNPETVIRFSLPVAGYTKGVVYDVLGKEVTTLLNGDMSAGNHEVRFNAIDLSSGVYFFRLESGNFSSAIKMVVGK